MTTKFDVSDEQLRHIDGLISDLKYRLSPKSECPLDPEEVITSLKLLTESKIYEILKKEGEEPLKVISKTSYLKLISLNADINLEASDGSKFIYNPDQTLDPLLLFECFQECKLPQKGEATPKTPVSVFELTKSGTGKELFQSFNLSFNKLVLTQNQIFDFCKDHYSLISDEYGSFALFLTKENGKFFIINVSVELGVIVDGGIRNFFNEDVFSHLFKPKLIVPRILID